MDGELLNAEIAVVGGGFVGSVLSARLAAGGRDVTVVEARPPGSPLDPRTTALAPSTRSVLAGLGVWEEVERAAQPIRAVHVSEERGFGFARLDAATEGAAALGWVVANPALQHVLEARARDGSGVRWIQPATVTALEATPRGVRLTLDDRSQVAAKLAVIADGTGSTTRDLAGFHLQRHPYGQHAVVSELAFEQPHGGSAFERFTDDGAMALLPRADGLMGLIWSVPEGRAGDLLDRTPEGFRAALQKRFGYRLGVLTDASPPAAFPLAFHRVDRFAGLRTVVLGNAAHTLHPVAGQGLNLGVRDAADLADRLEAAYGEVGIVDPGDPVVLAGWAASREADLARTVRLTDGLLDAFRGRHRGLRTLRGIALKALSAFPAGRHAFLEWAGGRAGQAPPSALS